MFTGSSSSAVVADLQLGLALEHPGRQHQRVDRRRPLVLAGLDRRPVLAQQLVGAGAGQHLAAREGLGAGDVVEVPVAEQDGDLA